MRAVLFLVAAIATVDPVSTDPPTVDPNHPPATVEFTLASHDGTLNGHVYLADGGGPHPTVVLLHGYPGNEKNLDVAQALRRAGLNAVFFHPRGAWGSKGTWSLANSLADLDRIIAEARSNPDWRADQRIGLLGHSMGGFLTVAATAQNPAVSCGAALAAPNLALYTNDAAGNRDRLSVPPAPQVWAASYTLWGEIVAAGQAFNTERLAKQLAAKPVLLIAGANDAVVDPTMHHTPVVNEIRRQGGGQLEALVLPADHAFSTQRMALTRAIVEFFTSRCGFRPLR